MVDAAIADNGIVHEDEYAIARTIAAGDHAAFERLMRRHNRRLYRLARATLRDPTEAEDALQDAYVCAYRSIGKFRGEASLSTWLSRLLLNECFARLRRSARRQNVTAIVSPNLPIEFTSMAANESETPDTELARAQMRDLLERKLDELPENFRTRLRVALGRRDERGRNRGMPGYSRGDRTQPAFSRQVHAARIPGTGAESRRARRVPIRGSALRSRGRQSSRAAGILHLAAGEAG